MELYTLDSLLRRASVVDRYESLIWTERYDEWGDFELVIYSTRESRSTFVVGTRLAMNESYRVMTVETTEHAIDSEGRQMLTVKGRSLEAIMEDRLARSTFTDLNNMPKWILTGTPGAIARKIFNDICRENLVFADDEIPFLQPGTIFPPSSIAEPEVEITVELDLMTVYNAIKEVCQKYDLGFRLVRNFDESELFFDIYSGTDRTTFQSVRTPVVFSPELDNLTNITELTSISSYKNVAYVFHSVSVQIVTADNVSVEVEGFERRVMFVDAKDIELPERDYEVPQNQLDAINAVLNVSGITDIEKAGLNKLRDRKRLTVAENAALRTDIIGASDVATRNLLRAAADVSVAYNETENAYINPLLQQRGKEELAKNRSLSAFDGELSTSSIYKYNFDYNLGDLVEMRNSDGVTNQMRVAEQVFISDSEGERTYPTLTLDRFITPGSWTAWNYVVWEDAPGQWVEA